MNLASFKISASDKSIDLEKLNTFLSKVRVKKTFTKYYKGDWFVLVHYTETKEPKDYSVKTFRKTNIEQTDLATSNFAESSKKTESSDFQLDFLELFIHYLASIERVVPDQIATKQIVKNIIKSNPSNIREFKEWSGMNNRRYKKYGDVVFNAFESCNVNLDFSGVHPIVRYLLKQVKENELILHKLWNGKVTTLGDIQFQ